MTATLSQAIPALPVRDAAAAVAFYRDRLGFTVLHHEGGFADDETWRNRDSIERPVQSGAESFIAGTASCRIRVEGVDELYVELRGNDVLHPCPRTASTPPTSAHGSSPPSTATATS
jgi:catechol 2,3-dioxygenase-like lactoylglutathione lyase family enzyme